MTWLGGSTIWESIYLMSAIDVLIIAIIAYLLFLYSRCYGIAIG